MAIFIPLVTKFDPKGLNNAERALAGFQNFAVDVGRVAAAALTGIAVAGVREAAQFETSFAKIKGLVGVSEDEVAKLEEAARRIGPAYGKSANEAADALFFITSAGLRGADATEVLEAAAKASAAGLGDLNAIANTATAAMNTYGPSVLSGTDAVAALTEAVRLGQFAPEELAGSLGQVIPISNELGVSFQETTGLIAALTKGGLPASQAVTGIRGAMQALLKPTTEAKDMLEKYGFTTEEVRDSVEQEGLLATFEKLREAFGDNEEDFTRVIGSIEGLNAVLSLTGENNEDYREIVQLMTDDIQILDEAYNAVADTAQQKFDVAMSETKGILQDIGTEILERLNPYLEDFNEFMQEHGPQIEEIFTKIYDAIFNVAEGVGDLLKEDVLPKVKELMESQEFRDAVDQLALGLETIATAAKDFVKSELGQFLIEITGKALIGGIDALGKGLERVGIALGVINDTVRLLQGKSGKTTLGQLGELYQGVNALIPGGSLINNIVGAITGRRAQGGGVAMSSPYLVGERGPEIFIPQSAGNIIPNRDVVASTSNAGATYNITVNAGMGTDGTRLGEQIVNAIKRYERTSGPVFASA